MSTPLILWALFVALVYLFAWIDHLYFYHDLTGKFHFVHNELFEES